MQNLDQEHLVAKYTKSIHTYNLQKKDILICKNVVQNINLQKNHPRAVICKTCTNNIFPKKKPSPLNPEFALFTGAVKFCKCYQTLKSKPAIILVQDDDDDDIE